MNKNTIIYCRLLVYLNRFTIYYKTKLELTIFNKNSKLNDKFENYFKKNLNEFTPDFKTNKKITRTHILFSTIY